MRFATEHANDSEFKRVVVNRSGLLCPQFFLSYGNQAYIEYYYNIMRGLVGDHVHDSEDRRDTTGSCSYHDHLDRQLFVLGAMLMALPSTHDLSVHAAIPLLAFSRLCFHNVHKQADNRPSYRQLHCNIRRCFKRVQVTHKTRFRNTSICCRT